MKKFKFFVNWKLRTGNQLLSTYNSPVFQITFPWNKYTPTPKEKKSKRIISFPVIFVYFVVKYSMKKQKKERADVLLVQRELCESREKARRLILAGKVRIGSDHVIRKPSDKFLPDADFVIEEPMPYVSRGAYKLLPALEKYLPDLTGLVAADIGASTGGFTDLMLQRGLKKAYCIDSGRGQLHNKLRNDPRVECHEKTNARHLLPDFLPEQVDVITMDVSFISVTMLLQPTSAFLKSGGWAFILIKPQFEAKKAEVGSGGVVRDKEVHERVIKQVVNFAAENANLANLEIIASPITGPKGNQEYIAVFNKVDKR